MKDARVVEAIRKEFAVGLQLVERFKVGDRVAHVTVGDGVVTQNNGHFVEVTFQRQFDDGTPLRGCYDALWFDANPAFLFHRGTEAEQGGTK